MKHAVRLVRDSAMDQLRSMTEASYRETLEQMPIDQIQSIVCDDMCVGWVYHRVPENSLYSGYIYIYIIPDHRRKGIATEVYREIEKEFQKIGCGWWSSYLPDEGSDQFALHVGFSYTSTNSYLVFAGEMESHSFDQVRKCRETDYPEVLDLWSDTYALMHQQLGIPYEKKELTKQEREEEHTSFLNDMDHYFVIEEQGKIVCMGTVFSDGSGIGSLAVHQDYTNKGYGSLMTRFLTLECLRHGTKHPCVYCETENEKAMHIYLKTGYVEQSRETVAIKR